MKKGSPPCAKCENKGCGAYHDICSDYKEWVNDDIECEETMFRAYIPESTWNSRKGRSLTRRK